jgi:hypothetical protein
MGEYREIGGRIFYFSQTMPEEKRLPDLTLSKRFPQRLLNFFPKTWKHDHLVEKSGGAREPEEFSFQDHLKNTRKILIAWPERREEILLAFPSARALCEAVSGDTEWIHLCEAKTSALVQDLFPGTIIEWRDSEIAWHEPKFQTLVHGLAGLAPDTVWMLSQVPYPVVLQAALRATHAPMRIGWEGGVGAPFANTRLQADAATPIAARGYQALGLWRYAGFTPREEWMRIQADPDSRLAAADDWAHKRATPENTWLYVHDVGPGVRKGSKKGLHKGTLTGRPLDEELFAFLEEKIAAREVPGTVLGAVLWNPTGAVVARSGAWLDAPIFNESDLPALLAVIEGARGVIGFNGFSLHFASLVEVRGLALLKRDEALYDCSAINKWFETEWI